MTLTYTIEATKGFSGTSKGGKDWQKYHQEHNFYVSVESPPIKLWVGTLSVNQVGRERYYCQVRQPKNILLELAKHRKTSKSIKEAEEDTVDTLIEYHTQMLKALQELKEKILNG